MRGLRDQTLTLGKDHRVAQQAFVSSSAVVEKNTRMLEGWRTQMRMAGIDTKRLTEEQHRLQASLTESAAKGRSSSRIQSARDMLGVVDHRG